MSRSSLKASRSRYSAAGSKSDPSDALILADLLRTDGHRFRRGVAFRWACNKRLRQALTSFADHSRHASPWAAAMYAAARRRGCHHRHAVRILARAWLRVLWRCWQDRRPYDVTLHHAAQRGAAA